MCTGTTVHSATSAKGGSVWTGNPDATQGWLAGQREAPSTADQHTPPAREYADTAGPWSEAIMGSVSQSDEKGLPSFPKIKKTYVLMFCYVSYMTVRLISTIWALSEGLEKSLEPVMYFQYRNFESAQSIFKKTRATFFFKNKSQ